MELEEKLNDELIANSEEIKKYELEINGLEKEIKILRQRGPSARQEMLEKQLKVSELEEKISIIQLESDRKSMHALVEGELKSKKSSQYAEYSLLGRCYIMKYDLDVDRSKLEALQIKYKILQQNGNKDAKAYSELKEKIETMEGIVQTEQEQYTETAQKFSTRFGKNIDFSKSFTDLLYEYANENLPVRHQNDIDELGTSMEEQFWTSTEDKEISEKEKYRHDIQNQVSSIFTEGLDGTSEELAQVFSELYIDEIELGIEKKVNSELLGENSGVLSRVIKNYDNRYTLVYEDDVGNKVGIDCTRNTKTGEIEIKGKLSDESLEFAEEKDAKETGSISREQMEMQVVKRNIEKSMQGKKINEMVKITDPRIIKYLNEQNNLQQNSFLGNLPLNVYMISTKDEDGNAKYEFVAHSSRDKYTKLSGIKQVQEKQSHIILNEDRIPGTMTPMQPVDCQFTDKNGNSYFVTHLFGNMPMKLSFEESQNKGQDKEVVANDFEINELWHRTRINELLRNGRNVMGLGLEKVKSIYEKYQNRGREETVKENNSERGE